MSTAIDVSVREARPDEREKAVALTVEAYRQYEPGFGPAFWEQYISNIKAQWERTEPTWRLVAEQEDNLVGAALLYPPQEGLYEKLSETIPYPEIRLLGVHPSARSKGVATSLLAECARRAKQGGYSYLGLHTSSRMPDAVRLYLSLGFEREPRYDFFAADQTTVVEAYRLALVTVQTS
ncbi:GNAT family N-acetyltransferase [Paenibacillus sp. CGMCC 1.16610]|uniref:GNAT family N-acetyltransferase n=1 Tax=Paenibacillus anseongense TaxID=2682845 RepID=A0ABW9U702_9BACL|nr:MULTISPECIES: GNAT family N-acetyltransferase [Paenibacillus]MBA2938655.1 GNAT family N-acetyltransferase [Paenibacillus sp. CGMCC 1.16610]MVQ34618.1 GNAT family N-acetyltransferase [Paenibacillus anseongense]